MLATVVVSNDGHSHSVACTMESGDNILVAARGSLVRTRVATLNGRDREPDCAAGARNGLGRCRGGESVNLLILSSSAPVVVAGAGAYLMLHSVVA